MKNPVFIITYDESNLNFSNLIIIICDQYVTITDSSCSEHKLQMKIDSVYYS